MSTGERGETGRTSDAFVRILDGNTFAVSDANGDIEESTATATGMFSFDTRFLSMWVLTVGQERLQALSVDDLQYYETRFFLVPGGPTHYIDSTISVIRQREIVAGLNEKLTVFNHDRTAARVELRIEVDCDFADLFEVKAGSVRQRDREIRVEDGVLRYVYRRERWHREVAISSSQPAEVDERGLFWSVDIGPQQSWSTDLRVHPTIFGGDGRDIRDSLGTGRPRSKAELQQDLDEWLDRAPRLDSDWDLLVSTYRRSLIDLAALRFTPLTDPRIQMPAAGLPWFMSLFGRDSIFTSLQALPFAPDLAAFTIQVLGSGQGVRLDDFREEEPGKILREFRYGELTAFEERPHSPYFGAADLPALFVVLLDEYERWTGDSSTVRYMEPEVRTALDWIDSYADLMGNGYVYYRRRNEQTGLENQCWKESPDSISYRDGRIPPAPRATCELQGYAYDAKRRAARLAREFWNDPGLADRLEAQAAELK
ncbi:amylo-alpha-1,6-glucosidase, partial [Rugosimonospora acidiphila]|uniref:amylo-alpha-1,6-glucosidase n=1 Tax=Rugosimonospora acidiphila TaxID=556531 RepID=UPI0031EFE67B